MKTKDLANWQPKTGLEAKQMAKILWDEGYRRAKVNNGERFVKIVKVCDVIMFEEYI